MLPTIDGNIAEPIPVVWNLVSPPSLKLLSSALSATDTDIQALVERLSAEPTDEESVFSLLHRVKREPQLSSLFILASLKKTGLESKDVLATIAKRMQRHKILKPGSRDTDWTASDIFQLADSQGWIPWKLRFHYMPAPWLRSACSGGRWLELAGYCQHLLMNTSCSSKTLPKVLADQGIPIPNFISDDNNWNSNNLVRFIKLDAAVFSV